MPLKTPTPATLITDPIWKKNPLIRYRWTKPLHVNSHIRSFGKKKCSVQNIKYTRSFRCCTHQIIHVWRIYLDDSRKISNTMSRRREKKVPVNGKILWNSTRIASVSNKREWQRTRKRAPRKSEVRNLIFHNQLMARGGVAAPLARICFIRFYCIWIRWRKTTGNISGTWNRSSSSSRKKMLIIWCAPRFVDWLNAMIWKLRAYFCEKALAFVVVIQEWRTNIINISIYARLMCPNITFSKRQ